MATAVSRTAKRVFVVINPGSGSYAADSIRTTLARYFRDGKPFCEIHETGPDERLHEVVRDARDRGFDLVVAAGGDGTVSGVANSLVGSEVPLGIVPLGTANVLARELEIPLELEAACALLADRHDITVIDAMRVRDQHYFTHVGIGFDAMMIRDTGRDAKKRWGRIAYLWTAFVHLLGLQRRSVRIDVDGVAGRHRRASQVLIANCGTLGQPPFRWGPDILVNDGELAICVIRARSLIDFLVLAWHFTFQQHKRDPRVHYLSARRSIVVHARHSLPVQADGELIGETPVELTVVPHAVQVVVPAASRASQA